MPQMLENIDADVSLHIDILQKAMLYASSRVITLKNMLTYLELLLKSGQI